MAIAGLVFGILSVSVFFWVGPAIGGLWSTSRLVSASLAGNAVVPPVWPIWAMGLSIGVGLPLISLVLSIGGLGKKRGIAIGRLVTSSVGIVLGFMTTMGAAFALNLASAAKDKIEAAAPDLEQMQNTLDDPAFQERIQKAMEAAVRQQPAPAPGTAPAQGTPNTMMPGQAPLNPTLPAENPGEALPAEAPLSEKPQ